MIPRSSLKIFCFYYFDLLELDNFSETDRSSSQVLWSHKQHSANHTEFYYTDNIFITK